MFQESGMTGPRFCIPLDLGARPLCRRLRGRGCANCHRVGTGESGLVLSEEGNSACLSRCSGGLSPLVPLCVPPLLLSRFSRVRLCATP